MDIRGSEKYFFSPSLLLQGKPPTKKATVLNKVNKAPPAATGVDGKVTEHACLHEIIFYFIFLTQPV